MKFNQSVEGVHTTTNFEQGKAYKFVNPIKELTIRISSYLVGEPKFYGDSKTEYNEMLALIKEVAKKDPEYILKLAVYARKELNLRSAPIMLLGEASIIDDCKPFVKSYTNHIIIRADELTEVMAYLISRIGDIGDKRDKGSMPYCLKVGLRKTFSKFTEYHFSKYDNSRSTIKLKDVIRVVHPKAPEDKIDLFKQVYSDHIPVNKDTWEYIISNEGSNDASWSKAVYKMPIFALIRNLRNILAHDVGDKAIQHALDTIMSESVITKSKLFPFRFLTAYKMLEKGNIELVDDNVYKINMKERGRYNTKPNMNTTKFMDALQQAIEISVNNIPKFEGKTAILIDVSGSMTGQKISKNSVVEPIEIASLFGAMLHRLNESNIILIYSTDLGLVNLSKKNGLLANAKVIAENEISGSGTEANKALLYLIQEKIKLDRIIVLSDEQSFTGGYSESFGECWNRYKSQINKDCWMYSINLMGYPTVQTPDTDPRGIRIGGWSDKILNFISLIEKDPNAQINHINGININNEVSTKSIG